MSAKEKYLEAVRLAEAVNDIEGQATAHAGLAKAYALLGDSGAVIDHIKRARDGYKVLGDAQRVDELEAQLVELNP